jgi:hypothetical protein
MNRIQLVDQNAQPIASGCAFCPGSNAIGMENHPHQVPWWMQSTRNVPFRAAVQGKKVQVDIVNG